jgi:hypothetical protein
MAMAAAAGEPLVGSAASPTTVPKTGGGNGAAPTTPGGPQGTPALGAQLAATSPSPDGGAPPGNGPGGTATMDAQPDDEGKVGAGAPPPSLTRHKTDGEHRPFRPRGWKTILLVAACVVALAAVAFGVKVWAPFLVGNSVPAAPSVAPPPAPAPAPAPAEVGGGNIPDENNGDTGNGNSGTGDSGRTGQVPQRGNGETPGQGGTVEPTTEPPTTEAPTSEPSTGTTGNPNPGGNTGGTNSGASQPGDVNRGGQNPANENPANTNPSGLNGNTNPGDSGSGASVANPGP